MASKPKNTDEEVVVEDEVLEGIDEATEVEEEQEETLEEEAKEDEEDEIELDEEDLKNIADEEVVEKVVKAKKPSVRIVDLNIKDLELDYIDRKKEEFAKTDSKMLQLIENIRIRG